MKSKFAATALVALVCVALVAPAGAVDTGPDVTGYCVPENTFHNPPDVPPGGSKIAAVPGVRASRITVGGVSMPLYESGPAGGDEAVVFVHGNPGSSEDYFDLLPRVGAMGRRAIAFDLPGFGHADKPYDLDYSLTASARRFTETLQQLGIRRVHLVGHDIGGVIGVNWAAEHPRELVSATLLNTGVLLGYEQHHDLAQIWRSPAGEEFMESFTREFFRFGLNNGRSRPLPDEFIDRNYDDFDRATRCAVLKGYRSDDVDDPDASAPGQAAALRANTHRPALVVWGDEDPFLKKEIADNQRQAFPRAKIHHFPQSGHWPFIDDAERTRNLVLPFVRCQPTGLRDQIRLAVRPRRPRSGVKTFRFSTTIVSQGVTRPVCNARVSFGGIVKRTNRFGRTSMRLAPPAGGATTKASRLGLRTATRSVTVRR